MYFILYSFRSNISMAQTPGKYTYSYIIHQRHIDPKNPKPPITYELVYSTGEQTFYLLNPTEFQVFKNFSQWLQEPIEKLTAALNQPADSVDNEENQESAKNNRNSRTAKIISQAAAFNAIIKNRIEGADKNTIRELIWIPHGHSEPRFYYLTQDKLRHFQKKYAAQDEASQKAIQNERGGVSSAKLAQKLKEAANIKANIVDQHWNDLIFTDLAKRLGISEDDAPKVFFGNPNDPNNVFVAGRDTQLLRYIGGASIGFAASVKDRRFSIDAERNAELALARGEVNVNAKLPCEKGYKITVLLQDRNGAWQPVDLGCLRVDMSLKLIGFTGASVMGCASVGYKMSDAGQIQVIGTNPGKSGNPDPTKDSSAGIILGGSAFVGAKAGCEVACALEWQNPENGMSWMDVASIGAEGDLSAGLSINGSFCIDYDFNHSKFFVHAAAGVTWGLGCSGSINLVVDAGTVLSFIQFVYHKVMNHDYLYTGLITETAFKLLIELFTKTLFLPETIITDAILYEAEKIAYWWREQLEAIEAGIGLDQIATIIDNINANPERLKFTLPEVKGRMLYILTDPCIPEMLFNNVIVRYGVYSSAGINAMVYPYLQAIESAILTVLSYIQSQDDYNNVMTHMSLDPTVKNPLLEGEHRLYNNLKVQGYDANRLASFQVALMDKSNLAVYAEKPKYNQPVKPNQNILDIRGPVTFIKGD